MTDATTHPAILENEHIRLAVRPERGARVVSFIDKRTGREWLVQGEHISPTGEDARFGPDAAIGWDECFPTVIPWNAEATPWRRHLRDHGDVWGRPWAVDVATGTRLTTRYASEDFTFIRTLDLEGRALRCRYEVSTTRTQALPFAWAMHGLLAVTPEDRIVLPGIRIVDAGYLNWRGERRLLQSFSWPGPGGVLRLPLNVVHPAETQLAAKLYAKMPDSALASVGNESGWLDFSWDADELPYAGLWLNYGGWPAPGTVHHISIEPTTTPGDSPVDFEPGRQPRTLHADKPASWSITLTCREGAALGET
ncbi:MAG TPA: hypothetical protein VGM83_06165 [Devosiaceae bacterium]|jgi:hypothetical protein